MASAMDTKTRRALQRSIVDAMRQAIHALLIGDEHTCHDAWEEPTAPAMFRGPEVVEECQAAWERFNALYPAPKERHGTA